MIIKNAAIIIQNKKLLVVRKVNTSIYISPGGKPKNAETPSDCLRREIFEEINAEMLDAELFSVDRAIATFEKKTIKIYSWMVNIVGEPQPCSEIVELKWVSFEETQLINMGSVFKDKVIPKLKLQGLIE
ncbi:NUDIX domain-containing protein [Xenorhabdus sp. 18]|uniref:NUDIX hydrolase n=1 Tax=Xenorhabdus doucetiae TaxID=351671 RepID=UPI0019BC0777|nr:NUDIX domain-containing protein [Xenorhabdus sp. 18]MBD2797265.1 NUDIX domain-containing protein [Xenorhabdus sp. 18]